MIKRSKYNWENSVKKGGKKINPVIAITTYCGKEDNDDYGKVRCSYINAISGAGGRPVLIPQLQNEDKAESYIDLIDGLVLTGGSDVCPHYYGEEPEDIKDNNPSRDKWEIELFTQAYEKNIPVFGICRGMQLMNVALGGSLYQDINKHLGKELLHWPQDQEYIRHFVDIERKSKLFKVLCSDRIKVNSYHHQAIKKMAPPLKAVATAEAGIIEAVEAAEKEFILGVQWHPEDLINKQPCFLKAFKILVENAGKDK